LRIAATVRVGSSVCDTSKWKLAIPASSQTFVDVNWPEADKPVGDFSPQQDPVTAFHPVDFAIGYLHGHSIQSFEPLSAPDFVGIPSRGRFMASRYPNQYWVDQHALVRKPSRI
jgi:hypothetical protein